MKAKVKQQPFFNPDKIVDTIHQGINRDLALGTHVYPGVNALRYYVASQSKDFAKKYASPFIDAKPLTDVTFQKFLKVNEHMGEHITVRDLPDPNTRISRWAPRRQNVLLRARALMHSILGDLSTDDWFLECKNSSGTSLGVPYFDTSIEKKFTVPISTTYRAKPFFDMYLTFDNSMKVAIENMNGPITGLYRLEQGSRASTVEKNDQIRRMICVEPTANMFLQQGLMSLMYKRMKLFGLDVETLPSRHMDRARVASLTQHEATIDWSSASDCMSIGLLRWLLPPKWFDILDIVRSDSTFIEGEKVRLNMFSTMGNAATFPLETLVFFTMAHAVQLSRNIKINSLFPEWEDLKSISVFGDDCIVPSAMASDFIEAMTDVGFIINDDKSYYGSESFRESCGGDYLAGTYVRPYFIKAPTSTKKSALEAWLNIIFNSIREQYLTVFGELTYMYDKHAFRVLFGLFERYQLKVKLVPFNFPDDAGLKISDDIGRWQKSYRFELEPIYRDQHGSLRFHYRRYVYWMSRNRNDEVRYAVWLKNQEAWHPFLEPVPETGFKDPQEAFRERHLKTDPSRLVGNLKHLTPLRRKGGYVEAVAVTSHWDVSGLSSVR